VLLNLFLAILLDGFTQAELENNDNSFEDLIKDKDLLLEKNSNPPVENHLITYRSIQPFNPDDKTKDLEALFNDNACELSFYLIPKANKIRIMCFRITRSSKFEHLILFLIILNTVKMIVDTYIESEERDFSQIIDKVLSFAFLLEAFIKSIALGFCVEKGTYLRDYWNIWDFVIVVTSLVDVFTADFTMPVVKFFRVLRTLRPLRFVSHNVNMKMVVSSLLDSITSIINVIIVIFIVWLIFGILGVSLLKDRMGFCEIEEKYGVNKETVIFLIFI